MRTEVTLNGLCDALQQNCGDEYEACRAVGVSLIFLDQWRKDDKEVAARVQEAIRVGRMGLVSAAIKRGVHGVEEDVYYKGIVVGQKTAYSDSLLTTLLKAQVPEFAKDAESGGGTTVNVNVANIMPRADSYAQWLEMKQQTLAPASTAVIEATATEIIERDESIAAIGRLMMEPSPLANVL